MASILTLQLSNSTSGTIPVSVSMSDDDAARIMHAYGVILGPNNPDGSPMNDIDIVRALGGHILGLMINAVHNFERGEARAAAELAAMAAVQPIEAIPVDVEIIQPDTPPGLAQASTVTHTRT